MTFPKCTVPFWKGLKTQNAAAAVSKIPVITEDLHATVEKSVGVPKWGGNLHHKTPRAPISMNLPSNYTIQELKV